MEQNPSGTIGNTAGNLNNSGLFCEQDGFIYYNGTKDDHHLYRYDTYTGTSSLVWEGNLWNPVVSGNYVYFMNVADNYKLCRKQLDAEGIEILTTDRVDLFNVYGPVDVSEFTAARDAVAVN